MSYSERKYSEVEYHYYTLTVQKVLDVEAQWIGPPTREPENRVLFR